MNLCSYGMLASQAGGFSLHDNVGLVKFSYTLSIIVKESDIKLFIHRDQGN